MTIPVVVFPDADFVAVTALREFLAGRAEDYCQGVTVGTQVTPGVTPARFVRIRRIPGAGSSSTVIDAVRLDILIWHDTADSRMALAQMVRGFFLALVGSYSGVTCYGGSDSVTPQQVADPADDTKEIAMLNVNVRMRGTQLA